jgi:ABC-type Fe3+ transport system permease subunit
VSHCSARVTAIVVLPACTPALLLLLLSRNKARSFIVAYGPRHEPSVTPQGRTAMVNNIIWIIGAVVVVLAILAFFGLR